MTENWQYNRLIALGGTPLQEWFEEHPDDGSQPVVREKVKAAEGGVHNIMRQVWRLVELGSQGGTCITQNVV